MYDYQWLLGLKNQTIKYEHKYFTWSPISYLWSIYTFILRYYIQINNIGKNYNLIII